MGARLSLVLLQVLAILGNVAVLGNVAGAMPRSGSPISGILKVCANHSPHFVESSCSPLLSGRVKVVRWSAWRSTEGSCL